MSDSASSSALLDGRLALGQRGTPQASLWALASLGTAVAMFCVGLLVSDQNDREAGRIVIGAQRSEGYLSAITNGYAAIQGRPRGF